MSRARTETIARIQFENRSTVAGDEISDLVCEVTQLCTLDDVLKRAHTSKPPRTVADVVIQDEYTHDIVFRWTERIYLVFGTT
jgi:hypothetical protein